MTILVEVPAFLWEEAGETMDDVMLVVNGPGERSATFVVDGDVATALGVLIRDAGAAMFTELVLKREVRDDGGN